MSGTALRMVLLIGLLFAAWVGWRSWCRSHSPTARVIWLGALSVLGCLSVGLAFGGLAAAARLDPRLWSAPLDRLLSVALLVTLGWTLGGPGLAGRRWRIFLAVGLAVAALGYLGWAPTWAEAVQRNPGLTQDATGWAHAWDLWQLGLALAVGWGLLRTPGAPRWALAVVGCLAVGTLLELLAPLSATVPAWSRLGMLAAGTYIVAAAATQTRSVWPMSTHAAALRSRRRVPERPPATAPPDDVGRVLGELDRQSQAISGLTAAVSGLSGRIEALEQAASPTAAAPGPPPVPRPAPFAGEPSPTPTATLAERDLTIAAIAALEAAPGPATPEPALPPPEAGPPPVSDPALYSRAARYEQAIARLPWGVVVVDAEDRVALANAMAGHLLHTRPPQPGDAVAPLFPNQERIGYALHQARRRELPAGGAIEIEFDSPALRVEAAPLSDPVVGYLGTVLVLHSRTSVVSGVTGALVPALAEALRAPMTSILGYSELLNRMTSLSEDQVQRFLQRIDANLSRMHVMLGNLLTVMSLLDADTPQAVEPVDVEAAVRRAVDRALPQFDEKGLVVKVDLDSPLPAASADPRAFTQIMDNLLAQAALRSPQGGDVTVEAASREDASGQRAVVVSVRDRGSPLAGAGGGVVEIDEGPSRQVALTVVRLLAERQGGRAWAENDVRGARFHVRLPIRRAA